MSLSVLVNCAGTNIPAADWADPRYRVMGQGSAAGETMALYLLEKNPALSPAKILEISLLYISESQAEGVNYDVAFAQMCLETGFLKFGGGIQSGQHNFAGLGATGGVKGETFDSPQTGVRAHIQHLKAYASDAPLNNPLVDTRFSMVQRGCCPSVFHLAGTWAADKHYGIKLKTIIDTIHNFAR